MMPSVTELTYFHEITNTKNFSHAAKNLFISQPSLTRSMQNLESKMGVTLFVRHQKGVILTPGGKKLLLHVKPLLDYWKQTALEVRASHQSVQGRLKIGCHSTVGLFIHELISDILNNHPKVDIEIYNASSDILTQQVIDLELDIGIVSNPIAHPDLIIRKISKTETTLWINKNKYSHFDTLENINSIPLICNPKILHSQHILRKLKLLKIQFDRMVTVDNIEVIASLTANGCGVGIIPSSFVEGLYQKKLIRVKNAPIFNDDLYVIYRKEYRNIVLFQTVINIIKKLSHLG